jgi:hypothetical protein
MRTGKTRILQNCEWIEAFAETPHDILYTFQVLLRVKALRPEPTIYNNARDLKKYARTGQSPLLVRLDAWEAMLAHIARKKERAARRLTMQKKALVRERIKQLYSRSVATGEVPAPSQKLSVSGTALQYDADRSGAKAQHRLGASASGAHADALKQADRIGNRSMLEQSQ